MMPCWRPVRMAAIALLFVFVLLLAGLLWYRVDYLQATYGRTVGCSDCFVGNVMIHDLTYLSVLLLLALIGFWLRPRVLSLPLRMVALAGLLLYALDIAVAQQFATRLRFGDVVVYGAQPEVIWKHLGNTGMLDPRAIAAAVAGLAFAVLFLLLPSIGDLRWRGFALLALLPVGGAVAGEVLHADPYVHNWALRNVLAVNLGSGVSRPYSAATVDRALAAAAPAEACSPGRGERLDLIVLILESWSPYQSALFGGLNDWTPRLDAIARDNAYYTDFRAAGFSTNEGLMGILVGMEFLSPTKRFFDLWPFETAWGMSRTLPGMLAVRGYRTSFLTSGNLAFSRKDRWLPQIGFDHVEGHDHPSYAGQPRLHFDAPPDAALYARALAHLDEPGEGAPRLLVIENVSSHHPYIHPISRKRSAEAVFRYMDTTVGEFYEALRTRGFFEHGRLLIVSDHRAMVPIGAEELARFGPRGLSLVPAIWVGPGVPHAAVDVPFHQADILETVDRSTAERSCSPFGVRDMLAPAESRPRCLFHARGDDRDLIDVFCPQGEATVALAGDDSRVTAGDGFPSRLSAEILERIARYRIVGDARENAWRRAQGKP